MKNFKALIAEGEISKDDLKIAKNLNDIAGKLKSAESALKRDRHPSADLVEQAIKLLTDAAYDLAYPSK